MVDGFIVGNGDYNNNDENIQEQNIYIDGIDYYREGNYMEGEGDNI
jgi:hypothetical protein